MNNASLGGVFAKRFLHFRAWKDKQKSGEIKDQGNIMGRKE